MSTENNAPIQLGERAVAQVKAMLDAAAKLNEQLQTYIAGISDALGVPEEWQLNVKSMAFMPPPEQTGEPAPPVEPAKTQQVAQQVAQPESESEADASQEQRDVAE